MQLMPTPVINEPVGYSASLSRREVELLAGWERARKRHVTIDDIRAEAGAAAAKVASALVRKGALVRLKRGLYLSRPFRQFAHRTTTSAPVRLEVLLRGEPHYLGGLWAYSQNGLTTQQYVSRLDAFVVKPHRRVLVSGAKIAFHVSDREALDLGIAETDIEGMAIRMSGRERTLVDLLDRPRMAGGLLGAVDLFQRALPRADARRVAEYAGKVARTSTCQRIGLLLERAGVAPSALRPLRARTRATRSLISLQPGPRTGRVNLRWNVVENDRALDAPAAT
jgi:predicted transcriptional regulator of viral defense system